MVQAEAAGGKEALLFTLRKFDYIFNSILYKFLKIRSIHQNSEVKLSRSFCSNGQVRYAQIFMDGQAAQRSIRSLQFGMLIRKMRKDST